MHAEVLDAVPLRMIGCCRGEPVNVDLALATQQGHPGVPHARAQRRRGRRPDARLHARRSRATSAPSVTPTAAEQEPSAQAADYLKLYTRFTGIELGGRTVGLVGLGAVGREVAARLLPFKAQGARLRSVRASEPPAGVTLASSTRCCASPTSFRCTPR